jgi:hypothetical protein
MLYFILIFNIDPFPLVNPSLFGLYWKKYFHPKKEEKLYPRGLLLAEKIHRHCSFRLHRGTCAGRGSATDNVIFISIFFAKVNKYISQYFWNFIELYIYK